MKILLLHLDGKLPNVALMRIAAHHAQDEVHLDRGVDPLYLSRWDKVYASMIFEATRPKGEELLRYRPDAIVGGTGWDVGSSLEAVGISTDRLDYSLYPTYTASIGFSQRGCRLKCPFCVVPRKEGKVRQEQTIRQIWRGEPWPRDIVLLDNDFFGQPKWKERVEELRQGYRVNFNQGINARFLTKETAEAIASLDYWDVRFKRRCVYTAWDNRKDEERLFRGLQFLVDAGVKKRHIMVYMLLGYWPWSGPDDWEYRRAKLRAYGVDPYPMPFERNRESIGFQRFVCGAYDKRVSWKDWKAARYQPYNLVSEKG